MRGPAADGSGKERRARCTPAAMCSAGYKILTVVATSFNI